MKIKRINQTPVFIHINWFSIQPFNFLNCFYKSDKQNVLIFIWDTINPIFKEYDR